MSERVTGERLVAPSSTADQRRVPLVQVAVIVATYAVVGLAAGWLWFALWEPPIGVVVQHKWYPDGAGLRRDFSATALYVIIAVVAGAVLGSVAAVLGGRRPMLTLVAALAGAVLAGWLMLVVGEWLGPADPQALAPDAKDGTRFPGALAVTGASPLLAFPMGTLAALAFVFTIFTGKADEPRIPEEPRG
jgi:hypothetical protein